MLAVLVRRVRAGSRRRARSGHGRPLRRQRHRRSVRRPVLGVRPGRRGQPEHERVVRVHERHPAAVRVPAVQQLGVEQVRQAGRAVRAAHRRPVRLLADRRRHLQAADPRDRGAGRWRRPHVLELVGHRARLGPPVRGGPDRRRKRLDDAAGRERPHDHRAGRQLRGRVARPAPVARSLPDVRPRRGHVHGDRHHRIVERRLRQLRRLAAVEGQPQRVRRQDRRDLDRLRVATGRSRTSACSSTT